MRCARRVRTLIACVFLGLVSFAPGPGAGAQSFTHSALTVRDGIPTLLVDGRPFFFFGAAFFYERIPARQWRASMLALRAMGFNTLDLYVPWNWHELAAGDYDFSGRTNARRDLRTVLALARELDFKLVVRPGPVIRNEWRNGGYPAWLLRRPEYGMPFHDVLEGRYPATATLQNAHSDDAAAQWMHNATHMRYARRWLHTVLREFAPVANRVIAVQLDDDQGAYIDNQTWPAPHLQTYLGALETTVRDVVGLRLPVFINTYEMKVTASAPVWAMGNWYQSDAYSIGEHDRAALEFSTGLLQTQAHYPVAFSEFQAGWLAQPEDPQPRSADPTNTTLALHTMLGMGARGVIDFPPQDTMNPAGWEAPFANASYAWDAALDVNLAPSARYAPTRRFGELVRAAGGELASAQRLADGAIAYLTSAYDARRLTNADVFAIVARTQQAQSACRARRLTCDLVDLRFADDAALRRYAFLIAPTNVLALPLVDLARRRLARYRAQGGRIVTQPPAFLVGHAGGIPDATVLRANDGVAFLDIVNYETVPHVVGARRIHLPGGRAWNVGPLTVPARDAVLVRFDPKEAAPAIAGALPLKPATIVGSQSTSERGGVWPKSAMAHAQPSTPRRFCKGGLSSESDNAPAFGPAHLIADDRAADGYLRLTLQNECIGVTLAPAAGARAFALSGSADGFPGKNVFTTVGALRDDVAIQPPLSTSDKIGRYTRSFPAGMFNRGYRVVRRSSSAGTVSVTLGYTAPDVVPHGARFERTLTLRANEPAITVTERVTFGTGALAAMQRAVRYDSFDTRGATTLDERAKGAVGFFFPIAHCLAVVSWPRAQVEDARLIPERTSTVVRLRFAPGESRTRYALEAATGLDQARALLLKERTADEAKGINRRGGVAKW